MKKALLLALALIASGCGPPPPDGPYERFYESGQLRAKGTMNMGGRCGEWIDDGATVTYPPCPPGLADGP